MAKTANLHVRQPCYNAETEAAIEEAQNIMAGKVQTKIYASVAEMNAALDAEDEDNV